MYVPPNLKLPEDQLRRMRKLYEEEMKLWNEIERVALERLKIVVELLKRFVSFEEVAYVINDSEEFVAFKVDGEWLDEVDARERMLLDRDAVEALSWLTGEMRRILINSLGLTPDDHVDVGGVRIWVVEDLYDLIERERLEQDSH